MASTKNLLSQFLCPAKPTITEEHVPDLKGKVIIVTGSNTGLGKEIARIMYAKNARVYMMARSEEKTRQAMDEIREGEPGSAGELHFIRLDLADLTTIRASAEAFLAREPRLHLLFNNAGVGYPDKGAVTAQGYELQLGVNCVGPWGLTRLLAPALVSAAQEQQQQQQQQASGSVRVVWVASSAAEAVLPRNLLRAASANMEGEGAMGRYGFSKLGNYLHAAEFAGRHRADGVLSVSLNPGALDSDFWRSQGGVTTAILRSTLLHPPVYGAYTSLFAAFSPDITADKSGCFVAPWGQFWNLPKDYANAVKTEAEGGTGIARQFWEWTEAQWEPYL